MVITAKGKDGTTYVISHGKNAQGRAYDKDARYLHTFFPPSAEDLATIMGGQGYQFATTIWGDKTLVADWFGPFGGTKSDPRRKPVLEQLADAVAALKAQPGVGKVKIAPLPALQPTTVVQIEDKRGSWSLVSLLAAKQGRMAADRAREEVYFASDKCFRLDGKTGRLDTSWFPNGELSAVSECCVGPDRLVYLNLGPHQYGRWIVRLDHEGRPVDFTGDTVLLPTDNMWGPEKAYGKFAGQKMGWWCGEALRRSRIGEIKALYTGVWKHSNTHERGFYVSPNGKIVAGLVFQSGPQHTEWAIAHGLPEQHHGNQQSFLAVWDSEGRLITSNALGDTHNGHNVFMDRDGNIYAVVFGTLREGEDKPDGITDVTVGKRSAWGGHAGLVKFHWTGQFPLAELDPKSGKDVESQQSALWTYNGVPGQTYGSCTCHNVRCDMDYWARAWIPANHLYSVMVIDSNGNRVARIGRYGNVDDANPTCGKIHFAWVRALCVSDTALYVHDQANLRILRAALSYHAEETVAMP